jgi:Mn2+/Fe2+ NRAMP family transporter
MAGHIGRITSPITGKLEMISLTGYVPKDTLENRERYHGWLRPIYVNNSWGVLINLFVTILCSFLAFSILHPIGVWPGGYRLLVEQARFFERTWGAFGFRVFLFVAAMAMVDTYIVILDFVPRLYTEAIQITLRERVKRSYRRWYYILVTFFAAWTALTLLFARPGPLIIWGGVLNFVAMPILHVSMLYVNYHLLPKKSTYFVKPGMRWLVIGVLCACTYLGLAAWYLHTLLRALS